MCAECQGLGTLGIRAGILQKPIFFGFLERKKCKQTIRLMPSHEAFSLITILAEQTAEGYTEPFPKKKTVKSAEKRNESQ